MKLRATIINSEFFFSGVSFDIKDYKKALKLKENDEVFIEVWKERNLMLHRKYWALMNCTLYHLPESMPDEFNNIDNLRKYITILTGRFNLIPSLKGEPIPEANSISFKNMKQDEFESLYNDSLRVILKHFLKDISQDDFENDIMNFL